MTDSMNPDNLWLIISVWSSSTMLVMSVFALLARRYVEFYAVWWVAYLLATTSALASSLLFWVPVYLYA